MDGAVHPSNNRGLMFSRGKIFAKQHYGFVRPFFVKIVFSSLQSNMDHYHQNLLFVLTEQILFMRLKYDSVDILVGWEYNIVFHVVCLSTATQNKTNWLELENFGGDLFTQKILKWIIFEFLGPTYFVWLKIIILRLEKCHSLSVNSSNFLTVSFWLLFWLIFTLSNVYLAFFNCCQVVYFSYE